MSESTSWSEHDGPPGTPDSQDGPPVAEQMRAATRALRAHLSLVRDAGDEGPGPSR
jgi:hypothetical protein